MNVVDVFPHNLFFLSRAFFPVAPFPLTTVSTAMSLVAEWLQSAGLERHAQAFDGVSNAAFAGLLMQVRRMRKTKKQEEGNREKRAMRFFFLVFSLPARQVGTSFLARDLANCRQGILTEAARR